MQTDPTEEARLRRAFLVMAGFTQKATQPETNPTLKLILGNPNTTLNLLIQMKGDGLADATIESTRKRLTIITKFADINNPEAVKQFIANHQCSNAYKLLLTRAYDRYCTFNGIQWKRPKYKPDERSIKVPTKEKLEMLIANAGLKMAIKLKLSLETGMRPTEICNLTVKDIDFEQKQVYPTTAKHGAARILPIKQELNMMLQKYIITNDLQPNDKLFNITSRTYSKMYRITRNALAKKLQDPTLRNIRLYDFRHYFATALYKRTNVLLKVMQQLGHKDIKNTMIYTHLTEFAEDDYIVQSTVDRKEAEKLLQDGFDYQLTTPDGYMTFRKRK